MAGFALGVALLIWDGLHDDVHPADLGLVLGNTVYPDGTLSRRLAARLDRALELYRAGVFHSVLVSGAIGEEGRDEALAMRDYLIHAAFRKQTFSSIAKGALPSTRPPIRTD